VAAALSDLFRNSWRLFQHGEPSLTTAANASSTSVIHLLTNLLNCVLQPEILTHWDQELSSDFGADIRDCHSGGRTSCKDPLAYEAACAREGLPRRGILHARRVDLTTARALLQVNSDVRIVYVIGAKAGRGEEGVCENLSRELDLAASLLRNRMEVKVNKKIIFNYSS
jgi:hypothetical protein